MNRFAILAAAALALAGCTSYTLAKAERQPVGRYSVHPQAAWNKVRENTVELWTVDGPALQAVRFYDPLKPGQTLIPTAKDQERMPKWRTGMTPDDVMEFVAQSFVVAGANGVETANLAPAKLGAAPGLRFDFQYITLDGVKMKAFVVAAPVQDDLAVVIYSGHEEHYFTRYKPAAEALIASLAL